MPWCPKCKNEYVSGINVCSDCGSELVEKLKEGTVLIPSVNFDKEDDVTEFINFLRYSKIEPVEYCFDVESESYVISVLDDKIKDVLKLYKIFKSEKENLKNNKDKNDSSSDFTEDNSDDLDDDKDSNHVPLNEKSNSNSTSSAYVKKEEKYLDLKSTASTFTIFGILGLVYVYLNVSGTLSLLNGPVATIVVTGMFIGFIYVGITSYIKSKTIKTEISSENELTDKINQWLKENLTIEKLNEMTDETLSNEINFLHIMDKMKEMIVNEFGELNDAYLDRLVEEYYNDNFDND